MSKVKNFRVCIPSNNLTVPGNRTAEFAFRPTIPFVLKKNHNWKVALISAVFPPIQDATLDEGHSFPIYIYSSLVGNTSVGNSKRPLLDVVNFKIQEKKENYVEIQYPRYLDINQETVDLITIRLLDEKEKLINFENLTAQVTLHFTMSNYDGNFSLVLSSEKTPDFPNNTVSNFKCKVNPPLSLDQDLAEVAVTKFISPLHFKPKPKPVPVEKPISGIFILGTKNKWVPFPLKVPEVVPRKTIRDGLAEMLLSYKAEKETYNVIKPEKDDSDHAYNQITEGAWMVTTEPTKKRKIKYDPILERWVATSESTNKYKYDLISDRTVTHTIPDGCYTPEEMITKINSLLYSLVIATEKYEEVHGCMFLMLPFDLYIPKANSNLLDKKEKSEKKEKKSLSSVEPPEKKTRIEELSKLNAGDWNCPKAWVDKIKPGKNSYVTWGIQVKSPILRKFLGLVPKKGQCEDGWWLFKRDQPSAFLNFVNLRQGFNFPFPPTSENAVYDYGKITFNGDRSEMGLWGNTRVAVSKDFLPYFGWSEQDKDISKIKYSDLQFIYAKGTPIAFAPSKDPDENVVYQRNPDGATPAKYPRTGKAPQRLFGKSTQRKVPTVPKPMFLEEEEKEEDKEKTQPRILIPPKLGFIYHSAQSNTQVGQYRVPFANFFQPNAAKVETYKNPLFNRVASSRIDEIEVDLRDAEGNPYPFGSQATDHTMVQLQFRHSGGI